MRDDSVVRIYSSTKPMVSVALLMLYEEGRFQLTNPLDRYIPEFADLRVFDGMDGGGMRLRAPSRKPTIQDAFRHTVGFPGGNLRAYDGPVERTWLAAPLPTELAPRVLAIARLPLAADPGTQWRYGPEHDVQAYLVEKLSGMSVEAFLRQRLFQPLGMTDTGFSPAPGTLSRLAVMYGPDGKGGLKVYDDSHASAYVRQAQHPGGSSGLVSTARDELRFGQMLLNGGELDGVRILSRKTVELMLSNQLPASITTVGFGPAVTFPGMGYGLGIGVINDVAASGRMSTKGAAEWPGFGSTDLLIDPKEQMVIVTLDQFYPTDMAWIYRIQTLAYQALID
jgi:CubicO group peptidase (beta-lactamase class C family)